MADIPEDFDPVWYAARYADVPLSGLSPRDHFRRFGSGWGRSANGKSEMPSSAFKLHPPHCAVSDAELRSPEAAISRHASPIIDRPKDLNLAVPIGATASTFQRNEAGSVRDLAELEPSPAVTALVRLLGVHPVSGDDGRATCDAQAFRSGPGRIAHAWFADQNRLRLMFADERERSTTPMVLSARQVSASEPWRCQNVAEPVLIPSDGPAFHDLKLPDRLMPILLELSNLQGAILSRAVMPFPSLLPGGFHWAELKALQTEYDPMEDFWCLSDTMLNAAIERRSSANSSRLAIHVSARRPCATDDLIDWMSCLFGIELSLGGDDPGEGMLLSLPSDCIPTIGVLVDKDLASGEAGIVTGPYLIADSDTFRPRWSVCLPSDHQGSNNTPSLINPQSRSSRAVVRALPHLAIALRQANEVPAPPPAQETAAIPAKTIVIHVADPSRAVALATSLRSSVPEHEVEFLVRPTHGADSILEELSKLGDEARWSMIPPGTDIRDVARMARHDRLLSISDQAELADASALLMLHAMLDRDAQVGSASCALLSRVIVKRQTVLQPASGGIFPLGVSFATSPRLSFFEPDVTLALPNETFPVVANSFGMTLFRRDAIANLPRPRGHVPSVGDDIRLGLDLAQAGYTNLCTTKVSAQLAGSHTRRDVIDPFGGAYAEPGNWETLLPRVTLLRELF